MPRQRIAYIDFMKCLCIMLIVMYHIDHEFFNYLAPNLNNALQAFRLPMYYFISGIFFKLYEGFADFTRRKVNNILVPFVFFIVLNFVMRCVEALLRHIIGADPIEVNPVMLVEPFYLRTWLWTAPLWFLLSLFWVNILFYVIQHYVKPLWALLLVTVALSVVGYVLAANKIQLPLMMDTSLVALPYFVLGWGINRLGVLQPSRWDKWGLVALIIALIPIYLFSDFLNLHYQVLPQYWKLYFFPFLAILALFWACKPIKRVPLMCHYGRYSLIILGTHPLFFLPMRFVLVYYGFEPGVELTLIVFAITMLLELPTIWLLKTCFPRFVAQEPFFKLGWKL
ncbi:MAG: acyltransferase [Bacteroidales bacterium]|nr:acyltransferase [Bacteroidales bacterium]